MTREGMTQKHIERDGIIGTWNLGTYRLYLFRIRQGIANLFFRHPFSGFMNNLLRKRQEGI
jgi:hypothetical protein